MAAGEFAHSKGELNTTNSSEQFVWLFCAACSLVSAIDWSLMRHLRKDSLSQPSLWLHSDCGVDTVFSRCPNVALFCSNDVEDNRVPPLSSTASVCSVTSQLRPLVANWVLHRVEGRHGGPDSLGPPALTSPPDLGALISALVLSDLLFSSSATESSLQGAFRCFCIFRLIIFCHSVRLALTSYLLFYTTTTFKPLLISFKSGTLHVD